jgi:hypothetical protein
MSNKLICIILLILFIILLLLIIFRKINKENNLDSTIHYSINVEDNIENFASNEWTTNQDILDAEKAPLNDVQVDQVKNMITSISNDNLKTLITTQSPLLTGPQGPPGPQGPAGTQLVASGRLINKSGSFNNDTNANSDKNFLLPRYVVTRTQGTSPTSSLSFMDNISPFGSFQNWQLDVNNNIKNRYDDSCLTMDSTKDKLYMSKCDNTPNQKWSWDSSNRIISTTSSNDKTLKCIGLTKPEVNVLTTNIPNCSDKECMSNTPRRYLVLKDCEINNINEDELWAFV